MKGSIWVELLHRDMLAVLEKVSLVILVILVLHTRIILLSSFVIFFLCMSFGKFSYYIMKCIVIVVFVTVVEDCIIFDKISIIVG